MLQRKHFGYLVLSIIPIFACIVYLCQKPSKSIKDELTHNLEEYCHYKNEDIFPVIDNSSKFPEKSIFFHETSCSGSLNERQACAVEATAQTHPNWQINVFFAASSANNYNVFMKNLLKYPNIKYYRVHIKDFAKDTPLEYLVNSGALDNGKHQIAHTSDVLRFITLYKWSGVYIDLDMIMVRSIETLAKNFVGREDVDTVSAGILSFGKDSVGRTIANQSIRDFNYYYDKSIWQQAPNVLSRVLENVCKKDVMNKTSNYCTDFKVYPNYVFYPIHWSQAHQYFKCQKDLSIRNFGNTYGFHFSNRITSGDFIEKDSLYDKLTKQFCPEIYRISNSDSDKYE